MEGVGPTEHVTKGLSTLSQFLLYRQQLLHNSGPVPCIVADLKALRTNAGRAASASGLSHPSGTMRGIGAPVSSSAYLQKLCRLTP